MAKELDRSEQINPRDDPRYLNLESPCFYCKHLRNMGTQDFRGWTCSAYPEEIPYGIHIREYPHIERTMGQQGTDVFESKVFDHGSFGKHVISFEGDWSDA